MKCQKKVKRNLEKNCETTDLLFELSMLQSCEKKRLFEL